MPDFGFVGASYVAASITQDDQECLNWYCETDPTKKEGERGVIALYPTPGKVAEAQLQDAEVRGLHTLPGGATILAVGGNMVYLVDSTFGITEVGTINTTTGIVFITDNGADAYIVDGISRYSYNIASGTLTQRTDGAFTGGGTCDEVDNFMFYSRPDTRQWGCTDVSSAASGALNLGALLGASCNLVAAVADHRQVLLLGETYSERWVNVGTYPFPFAVIPGSSIQHGVAAKNSIAYLGEAVAFLALDTRGKATVIMWGASLTGPVRVSTFAVENAIQGYAVTGDAIGYTYAQSGHEFYVLTFPTADVTWCYDLSTQLWHKRGWRDTYGVIHRDRGNCCALLGDGVVVGDWENGKLYSLSISTYTDDGDAVKRVRRCRHLTSDLKRQFFSDLQIQFQPGVGLVSGQGSNPQCILRWSDDGGFTWGNDHILNIGKIGKYRHRAIKRRLGWSRDRIFEVSMTDPVYGVIVSANLNASSGAN